MENMTGSSRVVSKGLEKKCALDKTSEGKSVLQKLFLSRKERRPVQGRITVDDEKVNGGKGGEKPEREAENLARVKGSFYTFRGQQNRPAVSLFCQLIMSETMVSDVMNPDVLIGLRVTNHICSTKGREISFHRPLKDPELVGPRDDCGIEHRCLEITRTNASSNRTHILNELIGADWELIRRSNHEKCCMCTCPVTCPVDEVTILYQC